MSFPLLDLPLELRLQIYGWVYRNNPVKHRPLVPWLPARKREPYVVQAILPSQRSEASEGRERSIVEDGRDVPPPRNGAGRLLDAHRPMAKMPTALLLACRSIYLEAREIPFRENEFMSGNWFSSGVATGCAFFRSLAPWQRDGVRYAMLEVRGAQDLLGLVAGDREDGKSTTTTNRPGDEGDRKDVREQPVRQFIELCEHWSRGLRGLRLRIVPATPSTWWWIFTHGSGDEPEQRGAGTELRSLLERDGRAWIESGLGQLHALRKIEVELVGANFPKHEKVAWCAELGALLNAGKAHISVVAVEEQRWSSGSGC